MLGVTGMGWSLDVTGTMLIISLLYLMGPRGLFIEFRGGANLSLIFMMIWTGKWHRRSNCMTGAEWMSFRFGEGLGGHFARVSFAVSQIIFAVGMLAYMVKGVGIFISMFVDLEPLWCALILIGVATIYTMIAGFYGVVFSDLFQCALIIVGITYISATAILKIGSGPEFATMAQDISGLKDWMTCFPQRIAEMPKAYEMYECLLMFTLFLVAKNIVSGFGGGFEPHYFAARNERECGKLTCLWACLMSSRWWMMMGFAVLGLFLVKSVVPEQQVLQDSEISIKRYLVDNYTTDEDMEPEKKAELLTNLKDIPFIEMASLDKEVAKSKWGKVLKKIEKEESGFTLIDNIQSSMDEASGTALDYPALYEKLESHLGNDWQTKLKILHDHEEAVKKVVPKNEWDIVITQLSRKNPKHPELAQQVEEILGDKWQSKLRLVSYEGTVNGERILPATLMITVPAALRGLILITLISASMSTFSMTVNRAGAFFTRDIYQRFLRPKAGRVELLTAIYTFIILLVGAAFWMGYYSKSINDIWGWIMMGLWSGLSMPTILRLYWWRFNGAGFALGMVMGVGSAIVQRWIWPEMPEQWQFVIHTLVGLVGCIIGTFLYKPAERSVLEHFYKVTKPFGFWAPLRNTLSEETHKAMRKEHINDMIAMPIAFVWIVSMFLLPVEIIIRNWAALKITLPIFFLSVVGLYIFWYKNLPPEPAAENKGQTDASENQV
jgi:Na+/proline symporter